MPLLSKLKNESGMMESLAPVYVLFFVIIYFFIASFFNIYPFNRKDKAQPKTPASQTIRTQVIRDVASTCSPSDVEIFKENLVQLEQEVFSKDNTNLSVATTQQERTRIFATKARTSSTTTIKYCQEKTSQYIGK